MTIPALIDKQDNFEIIRDQIASILLTEQASQVALATTAGKPEPNDWKLRVFTERSNPWDQFLSTPVTDKSPIVNVWFDSSTFDKAASDVFNRQKSESAFNIDCYGYGVAADVSGGGHTPGDKDAALVVQRAVRLVRNILMAEEYKFLALRGLVWLKWPQSITAFQPTLGDEPVQNVHGARITLEVGFNEFGPESDEETLEIVNVTVNRSETGELFMDQQFDYT